MKLYNKYKTITFIEGRSVLTLAYTVQWALEMSKYRQKGIGFEADSKIAFPLQMNIMKL